MYLYLITALRNIKKLIQDKVKSTSILKRPKCFFFFIDFLEEALVIVRTILKFLSFSFHYFSIRVPLVKVTELSLLGFYIPEAAG